MRDKIFISYSRRDSEKVQHLYKQLSRAGYSLWLDKEELLPGSDWELEIRRALREAAVVIVCLSSSWVKDRGYVQNELRMALEEMKQTPEGEIFLIPIRLDDCDVPMALERLHWVDLFESKGLDKVNRAIAKNLGRSTSKNVTSNASDSDAFSDFMEDVITKGGLIYEDPWETWKSEEEREFKSLLKPTFEQSIVYRNNHQWESLINLWEPLYKNRLFRVEHPEWSDKPFFRFQIHSANCQMFTAFVSLIKINWEEYLPKAFSMLKEVLKENPYSLKGAAHNRLSKGVARVQNLNYIDTLELASQFLSGWGGSAAILGGVSEAEAKALEDRIGQRLGEIRYVMNLHGAIE